MLRPSKTSTPKKRKVEIREALYASESDEAQSGLERSFGSHILPESDAENIVNLSDVAFEASDFDDESGHADDSSSSNSSSSSSSSSDVAFEESDFDDESGHADDSSSSSSSSSSNNYIT